MAEFIGSNEKIVDVGDPVFFENKTDSIYEVSAGIIFKKSGVYEVTIVGNKTRVTKVTERKHGHWIVDRPNPNYSPFDGSSEYFCKCSECGATIGDSKRFSNLFCYHCGTEMDEEERCV